MPFRERVKLTGNGLGYELGVVETMIRKAQYSSSTAEDQVRCLSQAAKALEVVRSRVRSPNPQDLVAVR